MMGPIRRYQAKLFYTDINLDERVAEDHPLRRISELVDFSFIRDLVADCYGYNGNPSEDPIAVLKFQFLLAYELVFSERRLMRDFPLRLDWQWFCGFDINDKVPDHSVPSKARQLWGVEVYEKAFQHVLQQCKDAGLWDGETVLADSTQLKANASLDSRVARKLWEQLEQAIREEQAEDDRAGAQQPPPGDGEPGLPAEPAAAPANDATEAAANPAQDAEPTPVQPQPPAPASAVRAPLPPEDTQADQLPPPPQGPCNTYRVSTTDPDAATMKRRGQGTILGYRDHTLVDNKCGLIVATIAAPGDYDDAAMLPALIEKQKDYLNKRPDRVVGDSQYGTVANRERLRQQGIEPYLKTRTGRRKAGNWLDDLPPECQRWRAKTLMRRRNILAEGRFAVAHVKHGHRQCRWRRRWRVQIQCYLVAMAQNIDILIRHARRRKPAQTAAAAVSGLLASADTLLRPFPALCCLFGRFGPERPLRRRHPPSSDSKSNSSNSPARKSDHPRVRKSVAPQDFSSPWPAMDLSPIAPRRATLLRAERVAGRKG